MGGMKGPGLRVEVTFVSALSSVFWKLWQIRSMEASLWTPEFISKKGCGQ